jgi:predicted DNA-binding transcriptional regulator YafY
MGSVSGSAKAVKPRRADAQQLLREVTDRDLATLASGHIDYEPKRTAIDQLLDAIARRRACELTYHAALQGATKRHVVRPLRLVWHRSALYVIACLGESPGVVALAVHRIQALSVTNRQFALPRIDIDDHVAQAFGASVGDEKLDVEVRFDREIAWHVEERTFRPDERKDRLRDGTLRYRVRTSAQWEIIPWVASFGPLAELVTPTAWRELLRANVEATLRRYRGDRNLG